MPTDCDNGLGWALSPMGRELCGYDTRASDALLTPPQSHSPSPNPVISVSTAFYPGSHTLGFDLIFFSSDSVLFYVHSSILSAKSKDAFHTLLPSPLSSNGASETPAIPIAEPSIILDVILHVLYYLPLANHSPAFTTVVTAIDHMPIYSICPRDYIAPSHPGYTYTLSFAPLAPLEVYALAAHHDLAQLTIDTSSHLLSHPLATIDDATATRIGPVYLKRLFSLHIIRLDALRDIILAPPHPHAPTKDCDFAKQKQLTRAWALVAAYLAWEARPDLSTASIQRAFRSLDDQITCSLCGDGFAARLKDVVNRWACVDRTIVLG